MTEELQILSSHLYQNVVHLEAVTHSADLCLDESTYLEEAEVEGRYQKWAHRETIAARAGVCLIILFLST